MSYHIFQKETVNLCFPQKGKRSQKNQVKIKITKIGKNVMSITQFSLFKTFYILLHFKMKVACICIPKIMLGYKCIDFSLYTQFPNLMSYILSLE